MRDTIELLLFLLVSFCKLLKPGGAKALRPELAAMKLQVILTNRGKKRSPQLVTSDRIIFGVLFFNEHDLKNKMERFKIYFNEIRAHSSLDMKTPASKAVEEKKDKKVVSLNSYRWKLHCNELYKLPMAA